NAAGVSLQLAYQSGNTITATNAYGDISFTLAAASARQFTLTNAGTAASAFVINDTNVANHTAIDIQSGGVSNLTINENGALTTAGNISQTGSTTLSTGTGAISLNGDTTIAANKSLTLSSGTGTITQNYAK